MDRLNLSRLINVVVFAAIAFPNVVIERSGERQPTQIGNHQIGRILINWVESPNTRCHICGQGGQRGRAKAYFMLTEKYRTPR